MNESLRPATYGDSSKEASFRPRSPWAGLLFVVSAIALAVGLYRWNEARKADEVRTKILTAFQDEVGPAAPRLRDFRERIERWVVEAEGIDDGETWARPGFAIDELHTLRGVYLRIAEEDATDVDALRQAASAMVPDAIGRCLGLSPVALRGFYERGRFLHEGFVDEIEGTDDVMRLRVIEEQLRNNLRRDLPLLVSMAESEYFLLVVQRGETRHENPVDFYLWDMRRDTDALLMRTRAKARGMLITARIGLPGAPYQKRPDVSLRRSGAQDCSLASQARAATGAAPVEFASDPPPPPPPPAEDTPAVPAPAEGTPAEDTPVADAPAEAPAGEAATPPPVEP
jgi:hypothetical protein